MQTKKFDAGCHVLHQNCWWKLAAAATKCVIFYTRTSGCMHADIDKSEKWYQNACTRHEANGDPHLCPVKVVARRMIHIRQHTTNPSTLLSAYWEGDVRVVLYVVLRSGLALDESLQARIRSTIRRETTPRHVPAKIIAVTDVPRTISGKIVELAVRNVVHGEAVTNTDALANPEALAQFKDLTELAT